MCCVVGRIGGGLRGGERCGEYERGRDSDAQQEREIQMPHGAVGLARLRMHVVSKETRGQKQVMGVGRGLVIDGCQDRLDGSLKILTLRSNPRA